VDRRGRLLDARPGAAPLRSRPVRYDLGLSYATQRYGGGTFALPVADGSRSAGAVYGFDTFSISPILTLTYGGRYSRYDYLESGLVSPRVSLTVEPADHFRISTMVSSRAEAPGAEEFLPRSETGVWMPPQRMFSSLETGRPLEAERTTHMEVEVERDIASATVSLRAFRQHVADQLVTLFGLDSPGAPPAAIGQYFLTNSGDVNVSGLSAGIRAAIAGRFHGSVEYSMSQARSSALDGDGYLLLLAPSTVRFDPERIHDVSTSIETEVPETATRVIVLYRISNGFARPTPNGGSSPTLDSRFDVQMRQSLPFMDFGSAKWEMLLAVRNFFHETAPEQSIYDELLVVRPPKRIVGGLTLRF
jgi:outer membrane receptor protein involved in Fe transport